MQDRNNTQGSRGVGTFGAVASFHRGADEACQTEELIRSFADEDLKSGSPSLRSRPGTTN